MNLEAVYDLDAVRQDSGGSPDGLRRLWVGDAPGLWRYRPLLPVGDAVAPVSLGEGATPLHHLERLGREIGVGALHAKDETRGPTWSYKDRLATVLVTKARELGAPGVVVSSTGNHGAAIAAYAAHAGLPCIVFTLASVPLTMKAQMSAYGAMVVALEHPRDRWVLMRVAANALGWLPTSGYVWPPLGSPPFGMEGYKSIAYEIVDTLGAPPDWVVVPTSYGDGLYGTWKGFRELRDLGVIERTPRMAAAEPFGPLAETLRTGADSPVEVAAGPSVSFSIATPMGTFQALAALRESDGAAAATPDDEVVAMQLRLAALEGIYVEPSSAAGLVAIARLRRADRIGADDRVVVVLTSSGLKDPDTTARATPPVTVVKPDLDALREALRSTYAFTL